MRIACVRREMPCRKATYTSAASLNAFRVALVGGGLLGLNRSSVSEL